ncbi:unnamed protein product [Spirodela intermedia]|uniref:Uncharacterized protein n=1 Tax=Spirodela intermedia TaxID=51605 RepID=A0A7I8LP30_SPIIN|nr:unnamed protein product [Spirodela intermedia]
MDIYSHIFFRTVNPRPIPRNVAIDIPKIPTRTAGTTREPHPLAVAIPQAVVGPPTLAFEAKSNNFLSKPRSFPTPSIKDRCINNWIEAKARILGAVFTTFHTLPFAPMTVKNSCIRILEMFNTVLKKR